MSFSKQSAWIAAVVLIGILGSQPEAAEEDLQFNGQEYYYIFFLDRGAEHCYFESVEAGAEFNFEVESADGHEGAISFVVDVPGGQTRRYDVIDQVTDRYTIEKAGPVKFCFAADSYRKMWMYYSVYGGAAPASTDSDVARLGTLLKEVSQYLAGNRIQITHLIHQSFRHEYLLLQKHRVILYFSGLLSLGIVLSSILQVYMVKKLFSQSR